MPEVQNEDRYLPSEIVLYKKIVSKYMHEARLNICKSCDFFQQNTCLQCGCPVNRKTLDADESCPIHKW